MTITAEQFLADHPEIRAANIRSFDDLDYAAKEILFPKTMEMCRRLGLHPACRRGDYSHIPTPGENKVIGEYSQLERACNARDDLLLALKELVAAVGPLRGSADSMVAYDHARAAIAKAEQ